MANIVLKSFSDIELKDAFFNSLREDYKEFDTWYCKKAVGNEKAYVLYVNDKLLCFLYLKEEYLVDNVNIKPELDISKPWIKVGTLKVDPHNTKLGERLIKRIFDFAISKNIYDIYVTVFPKHLGLIKLLKRYGFYEWGKKNNELVFIKRIPTKIDEIKNNIYLDYPSICARNTNKYILSIYPEYHTGMFSDSILKTENFDILKDTSEANSIHKIYITEMYGVENLEKGDLLIIYRTKDKMTPSANYSSVATSLCVVEEYKNINSFNNKEEFINYCKPYNIFNDIELSKIYETKKYTKIIKMTYNISFKKRVVLNDIRKILKHKHVYMGFYPLDKDEFKDILNYGKVNESIVID
ncbi:TPA: GNAT family N-acetyltransferase [Campylobacter coli]|nr:GNAT family N-acetyltransferase [Campylobacter coli]